ncbi:hypothetical protein [Mesorhizobium sp. M8A.F.Ca.ET.021.01.1.1]|uniref:hypothetical protein n=1 Tax=Mesorhizobium sp. M8A.F.Ca.ET.021.01.1.1 TaxID=2496757 RepID=UPI000FCA2D4B|nr:hypothetical protein [Mesorhizobium sp. M8A.F.Ca.ET.021.01.1.1]RUW57114.1 hypothetical protein EOA36_00595 [Mesorhizobium sp. M8A.F.Ca.ET.021.01.1.1]
MSVPVEPSALDDALSLLEYEDATWVSFKRRIVLSHDGTPTWAHGVWNFIFNLGVFWVEEEGPDCLIVAEGSIEESDWSVYRAEDRLVRWFVRRYRECTQRIKDITETDRDLC